LLNATFAMAVLAVHYSHTKTDDITDLSPF
jgi:hypothetical protein